MTCGPLAAAGAKCGYLAGDRGGCSASILSLFDGDADRPQELTEFDKAYLGELYSGIPNIPGTTRQLALEQATGFGIFKR